MRPIAPFSYEAAHTRFLEGIKTPLRDGDTVTIAPAVAGGR